jgi:hypothetical protein
MLNGRFESTLAPNLFFAGELMHSRDYQDASGCCISGFRYLGRALFFIMEYTHRQLPWPLVELTPKIAVLSEHITTRLRTASSLLLMPAHMADILIVSPGRAGTTARYYADVPTSYMNETDSFFSHQKGSAFRLTIEHGECDRFAVGSLHSNPLVTSHVVGLHPVIRYFPALALAPHGEQRATKVLHLPPSAIEGADQPSLKPELLEFFAATLAGAPTADRFDIPSKVTNCAARLLQLNLKDSGYVLDLQELKWIEQKLEGMLRGDVFSHHTTLH